MTVPDTLAKGWWIGYIYIYIYIGGWGVSPTGKSYSFRSCVRACEAVCACETMLLPIAGVSDVRKSSGVWRVAVPFPLGRNVKVIEKLL